MQNLLSSKQNTPIIPLKLSLLQVVLSAVSVVGTTFFILLLPQYFLLALAGVLGLLLVGAIVLYPFSGFLLYLLLIHYQVVIANLPIPYIFVWKEAFLFLLVVAILFHFLRRPRLRLKPLDLIVGGLLLFFCLHALVTTLATPARALLSLVGLRNLGEYMLVYSIGSTLATTPKRRVAIIYVLLLGGLSTALLGILQVTLLPDLFPQFDAFAFLRMTSSLAVGPNNLGIFFAMIIGLCSSLYTASPRYRWSWLAGITCLVVFGALILSLSRTGYITATVALMVVAVARMRKRATYRIILWLSVLTIIGAFIVEVATPISLVERVASIFVFSGPTGNSQRERLQLATELVGSVARSPMTLLFGEGLGAAGQIPEVLKQSLQTEFYYTDNFYLELLKQVGILGVLLYLFTIVSCLFVMWDKWRRRREPLSDGILLASMAIVMIFIVGALAAPVGSVYISSTYFWLMIALVRNL